MIKKFIVRTLIVVIVAAVGIGFTRPLLAGTLPPSHPMPTTRPMQHVGPHHMGIILKSIDLAIKDLQAGKTSSALEKLLQVKSFIERLSSPTAAVKHKAAFVNARCPIMGNPINPATVTENLTREYKGQRVAFCCAMCPGKWDKLTDAQKDAKLKEAAK
ncbi:MAG: hypothetical protein WC975_15640 [Phycisphaerae bacterium]